MNRNKIVAIVLVAVAVVLYTMAVVDFVGARVADGVTNVLVACSDLIIAWVLWRIAFMEAVLKATGESILDLIKALEKGVPATLTIKDGKGTMTLGHDDDDDDSGEIPEEELTDDEKRIKRMAEEYDELAGRYERLTAFLASDKFKTLPENSRNLLQRQHEAMGEYQEALKQRIRIECDGTAPSEKAE